MRRLLHRVPHAPVAVGGAAGGTSLVAGGPVGLAVALAAAVGGLYALERFRKSREKLLP